MHLTELNWLEGQVHPQGTRIYFIDLTYAQ